MFAPGSDGAVGASVVRALVPFLLHPPGESTVPGGSDEWEQRFVANAITGREAAGG